MNARKIVLIISLMIMSTIVGSENSAAATWQKNIGRTKVVEIESSGEATSDSPEEFQEAVESLPSAYANGQTQIEKPNKSDSLFTPQARIIGGSEIVEDRYPWLVAMYKKNFKSNSKAQLCGGSLITPNIVLSAAHCLDRVNHVNVGRHHLIKDDQDNYEEFNITEKVVHPGFDPKTYDNDFALFKLSGRSKFKTISLSGMTSRYARTSDMLDVIGWGMTKSDMTNPSLVPLEAQVQILDNQQCQQNYFFTSITDNMMCAAYDGRDACQGDSGGPLIIKGNNAKQDVLAGIVSFGSGCANGKYPGVYARVSSAIGWIATNALALSKASPTSIPTQAPVSPAPTNSPIEVSREKNYPARVEVDTYEKPSTLALHPTPFPVQAPSLPTVKLDQPKGEQLFFTGDDISKKIKQKKIRPRASDVASSIEQRSSAFGSTNSGTEDSSDAYSLSCNTKIERISQLVASLLLLHFIH